jgi:hypothetical protein
VEAFYFDGYFVTIKHDIGAATPDEAKAITDTYNYNFKVCILFIML